VEVVVKGRHYEVSDRFRAHVEEKLSRLEKYDQRIIRVDVEVCKEPNPRLAEQAVRVEITIRSRGPVLRAEAAAEDAMEAVANCTPASAAAVELLPRLESQIARRGACAHPDGAVGLAASARRVFAKEIELHLAGRCSATDRRPLLPIPAGPRNWR